MNKEYSLLATLLILVLLSGCQYHGHSFINENPVIKPTDDISKNPLLLETMLVATKCCACNVAEVSAISAFDRENISILVNDNYIYRISQTLNGQKLGVLSSDQNERILHVIVASTQEIIVELRDNIIEFSWSVSGDEIFYLRQDETLYRYNLTNAKATPLLQGVSNISISPDGKWLGVSIREQRKNSPYFGYFTFRVFNLKNGDLLMTSDHTDFGRIGSNKSIWSPESNQIVVLFGPLTTQASKVVIYEVQPQKLEIIKSIIAQETYQQDFGTDLRSVEFADMAWSPNKEDLLIIRSTSDAQPGGEVLRFNTNTWNYSHLPFGENVTNLSWSPDGNWLAYTKASQSSDSCKNRLKGEILLANIHNLEAQTLITDTLYTVAPVWQH